MPNNFPASFSPPGPDIILPGRPIYGSFPDRPGEAMETLGDALNWLLSELHAKPVFVQNWTDGLCQQSAAGLTRICTWAVPALTDQHTTLRLAVYARALGVSGSVEFRSVNAGDAVSSPIGAARIYESDMATGDFEDAGAVKRHLNVSFVDGVEYVEMWLAGDGADEVIVDMAHGQFLPLEAPLATMIDGVSPWDELELDPDEDLTSAKGKKALAQLEHLLSRRQVYLNWSALEASSHPDALAYMSNYSRDVQVPVHPGTLDEDWRLSARVRASNPGGADDDVIIGHAAWDAGDATRLTVPAGAGITWYSTAGGDIPATIQLPEPAAARGQPDRSYAYLRVHPLSGDNALIHSIMIEGR